MRKVAICLVAGFAAAASGAKKPDVPVDPGPPPASVEDFRRLATDALLAGFFDPGAAQVTWDRGITAGYWKPLLQKKIPGWFTCGMVNGKNRMGGYVGARRFVVVEFQGRVVFSQVGESGPYDMVEIACQQAINQGVIPTAGADSIPAAAALDPNVPRIGITWSVVPDGAYVNQVEPGSPAAETGILAGMVISQFNGIPLKGFDKATIERIITAASGKFTLTLIGKGDVVIEKRSANAS